MICLEDVTIVTEDDLLAAIKRLAVKKRHAGWVELGTFGIEDLISRIESKETARNA